MHKPQHSSRAWTRREFLGWAGAGSAALLAPSALADFELPDAQWLSWQRTLFQSSASRRYSSDRHTDARMHLGGIGTGNFELGADGQLTSWQLCNNLREGRVPFYFAIKAGETCKLLQTAGGPDWSRIRHIEMFGDYPVATLQFQDADLPVTVELEAFTPFSPLEVDLSSTPAAIFNFRLSNPSGRPQEVSLAALPTNPVGYCSIGAIEGVKHPSLGWNVNESFRQDGAAGFSLTARAGNEPTLDRPVTIWVLKDLFREPPDPHSGETNYASVDPRNLAIPPLDRPDGLKVEVISPLQLGALSPRTVIWLEGTGVDISAPFLRNIREAVRQGATLLFSGSQRPLMDALAQSQAGNSLRPDIVFEDFEGGYEKWKVEGEAFGAVPSHGPMGDQNPVSGFLGKGLVNSYRGNDDLTGKMTSQSFMIDRHFIRFLVGGGHFPETQIRLVVDGRVERTASGKDDEHLGLAGWDVREWAGRRARLEIVDNKKGGWGHINVDQIVFSDSMADPEMLKILDELLPFHFTPENLREDSVKSTAPTGVPQFTRPFGSGKVVVLEGQVLDATHTDSPRVRQQAYSLLCGLAGATYTMTDGQAADSPGFGSLALSVLSEKATGLAGFEDNNVFWEQFRQTGALRPMESQSAGPTAPGRTLHCALAASVSIPPGGSINVPFVLTWHYPNRYNAAGTQIGAYYATQWPDARAVMTAAIANYPAWRAKTESFRQTFYQSTLPHYLLDALTANAAIARHIGVVFRIANGDVYGWEGSNGSCPPTCTHVWGYEQSFAHLFPTLEKEMRRIDFTHQQEADGGIHNRTEVPSPPHPTGEHPFTDGHASCILKAYREALNSPDETFFRTYWPHVKRALQYLIDRDAAGAGGIQTGVLQDTQWNTYDEALHGVTTFISGYYLAALRAGEEWARRMGEDAMADAYYAIFSRGQARLVALCWNGEYFQQFLPDYAQRGGEVGPGCMSDQLLGQWWAHQLGLGYILPEEKVKSALRSIYKYNFKSDLTGWKHWPRAFAGAGDKGLIVCTWPKGGRPTNPLLYCDEVWTGMEYHVAAHLVYEGFTEEAFAIVKGARDRYDGAPRPPIARNPWCEIECGGHYTRAMSSWSLLTALSGFHCDGPRGRWSFRARYQPEKFRCFVSGPEGWGWFGQATWSVQHVASFVFKSGMADVRFLEVGLADGFKPSSLVAKVRGESVSARLTIKDNIAEIRFDPVLCLRVDDQLVVTLS